MVNYAKMEEVWRSYGPVEPIGPKSARGRANGKIIAGVAAVCAVGVAAGLWMRTSPERAAEPSRTALEGTTPESRSDREGALAQAAELQAELQLAVADGASQPLSGTVSPSYGPSPAPEARYLPAPPPRVVQSQAPPAQRPVSGVNPRPPARQAPAATSARPPAQAAAPPPARPTAQAARPMVVASNAPPLRQYPRTAPVPSRAAPAPVQPAPAAAAPSPRAQGPSFDCGRARTSAERMVCDSPDLAALDRRLAAELAAAVAAGHNVAALQRDQDDWRRRREAAAPDPRAVTDSYQRRIGQLRSMQ